jgi:hypothetical protein
MDCFDLLLSINEASKSVTAVSSASFADPMLDFIANAIEIRGVSVRLHRLLRKLKKGTLFYG